MVDPRLNLLGVASIVYPRYKGGGEIPQGHRMKEIS